MESDKPTRVICSLIAMDHANLCYRVCSTCEKTLSDNSPSQCRFCQSRSKRLFRVLVSIATDTKVLNVICFDRAAKVMFGCSADDFFDFAKLHPFAAETAAKILEAEMFDMILSKPTTGNARHLRVASITPLRSAFQPAIETLRELYG